MTFHFCNLYRALCKLPWKKNVFYASIWDFIFFLWKFIFLQSKIVENSRPFLLILFCDGNLEIFILSLSYLSVNKICSEEVFLLRHFVSYETNGERSIRLWSKKNYFLTYDHEIAKKWRTYYCWFELSLWFFLFQACGIDSANNRNWSEFSIDRIVLRKLSMNSRRFSAKIRYDATFYFVRS